MWNIWVEFEVWVFELDLSMSYDFIILEILRNLINYFV